MPFSAVCRDGRVIMLTPVAGGQCSECVARTLQNGPMCHTLPSCHTHHYVEVASSPARPCNEAYSAMLEDRARMEKVVKVGLQCYNWYAPRYKVEALMGLISSPSILAFVLPEVIVEALDTFGAPKDWHLLALEMPFQAGRSIYYCRSRAEHESLWKVSRREKLPQAYKTATLPGRYIRRHWPEVSDTAVRDLVAKVAAQNEVIILREMGKMIEAVNEGPYSCMAWNSSGDDDQPWFMGDEGHGEDGELTAYHPYMAYDPSLGWAMAVRKDKYGDIAARALVYEADGHKCFVRSYGNQSEGGTGSDVALEAYLKSQGYAYLDAWPQGSKLMYIENERGEAVVPYTDPGPNRRPENANRFVRYDEDSKSYFVRCDKGRYIFDNTDGSYDTDIYGTDSIKSLDEIFTNTIQDEESEVCSSPFDVESLQAPEQEVEPQLRDVAPVATTTVARRIMGNFSGITTEGSNGSVPIFRYTRITPEDLNGLAPSFRCTRETEHGIAVSGVITLIPGQLGLNIESMAINSNRTVAPQQVLLQGVNYDN